MTDIEFITANGFSLTAKNLEEEDAEKILSGAFFEDAFLIIEDRMAINTDQIVYAKRIEDE